MLRSNSLMFGSNSVRARPTAAASLAGLCLWVACSSGENNFFKEPPPGSSGHSGAGTAGSANAQGGASNGGSANQSGGMSALGGSTTGGTSEVGGSNAMAGETGAGSGGTDTTGGTSNAGGTQGNAGGTGGTGGKGGDTGVTGGRGGTDEGGAGTGAGEGGVSASAGEGGVAVGGMGGTSAGSGGTMAGSAGTTAGSGGTTAGNGGVAGSSGASAGTAGMGGAGTSGAGGTSAGAGGASSPTPCSSDGACTSGQYCKKSTCDSSATGVCAVKPQSCSGTDAEFVPVCGCDHMTYYTACVAAREGVNVAQSGECSGTTVACTRSGGGSSCSPSRSHAACYRARSSCSGTAPDAGVCWVLPDTCPTEDASNTYCNLGSPVCVGLCQGLVDNDPLWRNSGSCTH